MSLRVSIREGKDITQNGDKKDIYIKTKLSSNKKVHRTPTKKDTSDPVYNEIYHFTDVVWEKDSLELTIMDADTFSDDLLCKLTIPLESLTSNATADDWFQLPTDNGVSGLLYLELANLALTTDGYFEGDPEKVSVLALENAKTKGLDKEKWKTMQEQDKLSWLPKHKHAPLPADALFETKESIERKERRKQLAQQAADENAKLSELKSVKKKSKGEMDGFDPARSLGFTGNHPVPLGNRTVPPFSSLTVGDENAAKVHHGAITFIAHCGVTTFSSGADLRICAWDTNTHELKGELLGHKYPPNYIISVGNQIWSSAADQTSSTHNFGEILVWNSEDFTLIKRVAVSHHIYCLCLMDTEVWAGCDDGIRIWSGTAFIQLEGEEEDGSTQIRKEAVVDFLPVNHGVYCIRELDEKAWVGDDHGVIRVYAFDYDGGKRIPRMISENSTKNKTVEDMCFSHSRVFSVGNTVKMWAAGNCRLLDKLGNGSVAKKKEHGAACAITADDDVWCGYTDASLRINDAFSGKLFREVFFGGGWVRCIARVSSSTFWTGSSDGVIRVWASGGVPGENNFVAVTAEEGAEHMKKLQTKEKEDAAPAEITPANPDARWLTAGDPKTIGMSHTERVKYELKTIREEFNKMLKRDCGAESKLDFHLDEHKHVETPTCPYCNVTFESDDELMYHVRDTHLNFDKVMSKLRLSKEELKVPEKAKDLHKALKSIKETLQNACKKENPRYEEYRDVIQQLAMLAEGMEKKAERYHINNGAYANMINDNIMFPLNRVLRLEEKDHITVEEDKMIAKLESKIQTLDQQFDEAREKAVESLQHSAEHGNASFRDSYFGFAQNFEEVVRSYGRMIQLQSNKATKLEESKYHVKDLLKMKMKAIEDLQALLVSRQDATENVSKDIETITTGMEEFHGEHGPMKDAFEANMMPKAQQYIEEDKAEKEACDAMWREWRQRETKRLLRLAARKAALEKQFGHELAREEHHHEGGKNVDQHQKALRKYQKWSEMELSLAEETKAFIEYGIDNIIERLKTRFDHIMSHETSAAQARFDFLNRLWSHIQMHLETLHAKIAFSKNEITTIEARRREEDATFDDEDILMMQKRQSNWQAMVRDDEKTSEALVKKQAEIEEEILPLQARLAEQGIETEFSKAAFESEGRLDHAAVAMAPYQQA